MDNVTHSLVGLAMARSGLNRYCPRSTLLLILAANAPDVDFITASRGALTYLEAHRGYTHSVFCIPVVALLPVLVVAAVFRQKLPWTRAWVLCSIAVASHLLIDWTNSYGVRLLLPFSSKWFALDLNSLYDAWIMGALVFAALWPHFSQLVSREIGARASVGRGTAIFALLFFVFYDCGRALLHGRATAQLNSLLYDGSVALQVAALPEPFTPLRWTAIVETPNDYRSVALNPLGQVDMQAARIWYKPALTAALKDAKSTEPFRYFLYFARFPVWSVQPVEMNGDRANRVDLTDLRFGVPGAGSFHCVAVADSQGRVREARFTYGSGAQLGWGRDESTQ